MNRKVVAERLKAVLERKNWTVYGNDRSRGPDNRAWPVQRVRSGAWPGTRVSSAPEARRSLSWLNLPEELAALWLALSPVHRFRRTLSDLAAA